MSEDNKPLVPGLRADDPDIHEKVCRHFQDPHQMDRLMNRLFGPDGWTFDPIEETWNAPNPKGPGVYVVRRGGHWDLLEAAL
jgi:hypothetical protein